MEVDKEKSIKPGPPKHPRLSLSLSKDCFNFSIDDNEVKEAMKNYSSSMNNWLVLIVISNPGFMLKVSTFENRVPEEIIEERSRHM